MVLNMSRFFSGTFNFIYIYRKSFESRPLVKFTFNFHKTLFCMQHPDVLLGFSSAQILSVDGSSTVLLHLLI